MTSPTSSSPSDSSNFSAAVDDGFIDGLASLDTYFRLAPDSPAPVAAAPVAVAPVVARRASRQYCEGCREEIDSNSADTVSAVQQLGGHPPMWGLPRTFHAQCWNHHEGAYRRT